MDRKMEETGVVNGEPIVDHCDEIECPNCGEALEEEWCCQSDNEGNEHDCLMGYKCTNDECGIRFHPNGEEI